MSLGSQLLTTNTVPQPHRVAGREKLVGPFPSLEKCGCFFSVGGSHFVAAPAWVAEKASVAPQRGKGVTVTMCPRPQEVLSIALKTLQLLPVQKDPSGRFRIFWKGSVAQKQHGVFAFDSPPSGLAPCFNPKRRAQESSFPSANLADFWLRKAQIWSR